MNCHLVYKAVTNAGLLEVYLKFSKSKIDFRINLRECKPHKFSWGEGQDMP